MEANQQNIFQMEPSLTNTIIITQGTSIGAQKRAKAYPIDQVIFADSSPVPKPLLDSGKFIQLPSVNAATFIHELLKACLDKNATTLLLLSESEIELVLPEKFLFEEYNIDVIC
jgi:hypothetical protein